MTDGRRGLSEDTIVAVATPMGEGAIGVVRVSGPATLAVAAPLVRGSTPLEDFPSHALRRVVVVHPVTGERLDDALCAVMRAPHSATGEDVVEISCHGSPGLLRMVTRLLVDQGARLAAPGEFTRRAFLNGRLDLAQAEAVALLISARTERAVALAARALGGGLGDRLAPVRDQLIDLMAGLEVGLDFPDEKVGLEGSDAARTVAQIRVVVGALLDSVLHGRVVHEGLTVAIVGPPNAGKSSLINVLLGSDRAIVSPIPGTTRDVVEGAIALDGVPVRLLDTAGMGDPRDPIEAEGIRRSRRAIDESDLLLVVFDGSIAPDQRILEETRKRPRILVLSKSDLPCHQATDSVGDAVAVSSVTGAGIDRLVVRLTEAVRDCAGTDGDEGGIVATLRQIEVLRSLHCSLLAGERALVEAPVEAALVDLRDALQRVGSLLGIDVDDSILDRIFSTFCLGK